MRRLSTFRLHTAVLAGAAVCASSAAHAQHVNPEDKRSVVTVAFADTPAGVCYDRAVATLEGIRSGYNRAAVGTCNAALEMELFGPDRTATHVNRAIILMARGDVDDAIEDLQTAIARAPDLQAAHLTLGGVYAGLERWADAEATLSHGIALEPTLASAEDYFARGGAREELGDIPGAYADYSRAAELAPEWDLPRQELARFQIISDSDDTGS